MTDSRTVLRELIVAVGGNDSETFFRLCQVHASLILDQFGSWRTLPDDLRDKPAELKVYANTLFHIAQVFERSGHPQLMAILVPQDQGDNKLLRWQNRLAHARKAADSDDRNQALAETEALLAEIEESEVYGSGVLDLRARANGLKAECLFSQQRFAEARAALNAALEDCHHNGDEEGVRIYRESLLMLEAYDPLRPELAAAEVHVLEAFVDAKRLTDLHRFEASNAILQSLLEISGVASEIVETIRAQILGRLGFNEFKLGNRAAARQFLQAAHDLCQQREDLAGAEVYRENLVAIGSD